MSAVLKLATNERTARQAAIKRASARARIEMNRFDRKMLQRLDEIYRQSRDDLAAAIRAYAGTDGGLRLEVMQDLMAQVDNRLAQLSSARKQLLDGALVESARIGASPFVNITGDLSRIADEAVRFVHAFVDEGNGLQLSDRLWRLDRHARDLTRDAIENAIIQGHSASQAANEFLSRGQPVPADVAAKLNIAQADRVARIVGQDLMKAGGPRYNALRLFRTELNRAHGEAYMMGGEGHEEFGGWRFLLSPRHPETDICDMHARVNRYGLGAGVYPDRQRCPWPAHPNTLSYVEIVFIDEITGEDRNGKEDRISWLKKQTPKVQEAVLNSRMKRGALDYGVLRENQIATPWKVLKQRYEDKGIPIDRFTAPPIPPAPVSRGYRPSGSAVSVALDPLQHKRLTRHVLSVIDRVHGDGKLPLIPVKNTSSRSMLGGHSYNPVLGRSVEIVVNGKGTHRELTLAHEIGHFIDYMGVKPGRHGSKHSRLFEGWHKAALESDAIKSLIALRESGQYSEYVKYLLMDTEVWARSYAQYIAMKSRDSVLLEQLRSMQSYHHQVQWKDDDFEPILNEIDKLFLELGWLSET